MSRFSLSSDCRRQLIWLESGTAYHPENIQEKDRYPTCSIMVWAGIMINGRTRLHVVANGTMTGQRYIDEVLLPHVRLFRGAVGDKFVFMDDNATCHRTLAVQDCLDSEGIQRLVWPARSPDLYPIENVWDALGRQVAGRNYPPTNKNTLIRALTEEWDKLPQQLLDNAVQNVAREFDITHRVVPRLWKSFKTTGMCSRRHGEGRVRSRTPAEDRCIVPSAKRNRRTTAQQVANQFLAASGKQISQKTVARRLRGGGLYARRPVVCVPLTRQHRTARLQWCREHHNWTAQDWACVLFSDESRFSLSLDCRRQLIWRESGTAYRPENIQEKDRYPTCSIMVWACIMINGRTRLHVVANGTMKGQRYIDEVLLPHVRLFRGAVSDKFVFMEDNATCHRTLAVQDCLDSEGIQRLVWPARSSDLIPIENVWDPLGRQVTGRNYPPTNKNTLIRALTEEWDKLPQHG
ncbi:transposable element Tcb1 transposase [Trichonephila clavipes]|nr:transposable element Tcb1 transposase [Trichonephila clavipes]